MTDEKNNEMPDLTNLDEEMLENLMEDIINDNRELPEKELVLPTIALRGLVVFPNSIIHFEVGRAKSKMALLESADNDELVFLAAQKDENTPNPSVDEYYHVGTVAKVKKYKKLKDGSYSVLVEGLCKGVVIEEISSTPFIKCSVETVPEEKTDESSIEIQAAYKFLVDKFKEYLELDNKVPEELRASINQFRHISNYPDFVVANLDITFDRKQLVLEAMTVSEKLRITTELLLEELEVMRAKQDVADRVKDQINTNQREYYLREQLHAIQEELGLNENSDDEDGENLLKKLEELHLDEKTHAKIEKEIKRLLRMQPMSAESTVSRTYVETVLDLPWRKASEGEIDLKKAEAVLQEDHYGLDKVKERVLEYLAVMTLTESLKGPILCLVGPPGVGKTSIAKSIARATGREFFRMSLGGVRDEAEIRGHRRTYIGAIPGRIIDGIKNSGTNNPVFLLDEVDKLGSDFKGDPASALLEVLDPEQNKDFTDHYLEVPFDLSKVMFITTANTVETIPRPLMDRMEVIEITGYTEEEKLNIAEKYLIKKQINAHGLSDEKFTLDESALRDLINYYTRESGVRNLEREIANLCRKVARKVVENRETKCDITSENLPDYLGKKKFHFDLIKGETEIGVTTGLAWTVVGGDTLFIETTVVPGTGKLVLTGQLGEVMQESAKAGISYIRSIADKLGIDRDFYKTYDLHIHIPEGATPKDGPSAGVTMCTAMISSLTNTPVKKDIAMTGEITLRGRILPVGGIKEKVLAAHRAGIRKVLLPADNKPDIDEIPEKVRKDLGFVLIEKVEDALEQVFVK